MSSKHFTKQLFQNISSYYFGTHNKLFSYLETVAKLNALAEVTDTLATMCSWYHLLKISIGFFEDVLIL